MQPLFGTKDPIAIAGMEVTLEAVDALFETLLQQIQNSGNAMRRRGTPDSIGGEMGAAMGSAMRLAVQRQTIEALQEAIPQLILYGNPSPAARIVEVIK